MQETFSFAGLLILSSMTVWLLSGGTRPLPRTLMRLATGCYLVMAVSAPFSRLQPLALMAPTLAMPALALAVWASFRRTPRLPVLLGVFAVTAILALSAILFSLPILIILPQLAAILTALLIARKGCMRLSAPSLMLGLGALTQFAALSALLSERAPGTAGAVLFSAAGFLGVSLAITRISDTFVSGRFDPHHE